MQRIGNWLRNIANLVKQALNLTNTTSESASDLSQAEKEEIQKAYLSFLIEVLQATYESWGDAQVVFPLLAANTDKLNIIFAELLRNWATNLLAEAKPDEAQFLAAVILLLSNRISEFPLGDKASNMEIAITGYETALTVYTREAFPQDWAATQNNLGAAYGDRILGERANNLEYAIAAYESALEVYTREAFPQDWAGTQNNLGNAYLYRILGERANNLENAIAAYKSA
ncbi:hypothetical protein B4U84_03650, partial [Westiellopsis prolifica IICB1]